MGIFVGGGGQSSAFVRSLVEVNPVPAPSARRICFDNFLYK
jgi:hypothetical protein